MKNTTHVITKNAKQCFFISNYNTKSIQCLSIDLLFSLMTFCDMTAGIVIGRGTTDGHCALVERDC